MSEIMTMAAAVNQLPLGPVVSPLPKSHVPNAQILAGRLARLEPVNLTHAEGLFQSFAKADPEGTLWTYLAYGPFADLAEFTHWLNSCIAAGDTLFYTIFAQDTHQALGMAAYLRADQANAVIEIGHIWFSPHLQKTSTSTEAIYLLLAHAFGELGCRRVEWKCNALHSGSRSAAQRYGFTYEGCFRQHMIIKGRNRDTAWFSIIDKEWPALSASFSAWLQPENFDKSGQQKTKLHQSLRAAIHHANQPQE